MTEKSVTLQDGSELRYERGVLQVPVRRGVADSASLPLEFYRFFGPEEGAGPPILRIMGGPGWTGAGERVENPGWAEFYVLPFTAAADLVVLGQRGFGASGALECDRPEPLTLEEALSSRRRQELHVAALEACRQAQEDDGVEIEGFSVLEMAADTVEVGAALGYEKFQLLASSFGSHVSMAVLRLYPNRVAQATFNALEGPDHTFDMPSGKWAALERISASARSAEGATGPSPLQSFRRLVERSRSEPVKVELLLEGEDWEDLLAGESRREVTLELGPDDLTSLPFLGSTTFSFRWPRWYAALEDVANGSLEEEAEELLWRWTHPRSEAPAALQLDCGSGLTAERRQRIADDPASRWLRADDKLEDCISWGSPDLGDTFRSGFETAVPVVLIHGDHDSATPIDNALELLPSFSDHHFVWVAGGSHGALVEAFDVPEFVTALQTWLRSGDRSELPELLQVPLPF
ncbi:MAG: alpha/beta hydrolase [Acidobacteriota bacterium]